MLVMTADAETYYDDEFSLRKMPTSAYIRDERFAVHGWAVKFGNKSSKWVSHGGMVKLLSAIEHDKVILIGHNLMFDGSILAWKYGFVPKLYVDTMGMSRAVFGGSLGSHGLDSLAKHIGRDGKIRGKALADVKGVRNLTPGQFATLGRYACDDTDDTYAAFAHMKTHFPKGQYESLDWTIRMFTEPKLVIDRDVMEAAYEEEKARKEALLALVGVERTAVNSNEQFAALLREAGVEPATKVSKSTGKTTYAFAKTDQFMADLLEHEDSFVRILGEARVGVKSSIMETRTRSLAALADHPFSVGLGFSGAQQTHRLSAVGGLNVQNLPKGGTIRDGIKAPKGYKVVVTDSSNIELRVNCMACGQMDAVEALRNGKDLYAKFASSVFGLVVDKKTHPDERFIGKVGVLSLGYGASSPVFRNMVRVQSSQFMGKTILLEEDVAESVVNTYRNEEYAMVSATWNWLRGSIDAMLMGCVPRNLPGEPPIVWHADGFVLPSGLKVKYPDLRREYNEEKERREVVFTSKSRANPSGKKKLFGALVLENLCQSLARDIMDYKAIQFKRRVAMPVMQVHDELVMVVRDEEVERVVELANTIMSEPVPFWPDLPLACETGFGQSYGDAK